MHERTQRAIARLMFVFCCAVPTSVTVLCVLVTWTPAYHGYQLRKLEASLSDDTDLVIEIEDFRRPTPSSLELTHVRALDPETGAEVATVRKLQWVSNGQDVAIVLHQPNLQSKELANTWKLVHDRFLCVPQRTSIPVQVSANALTIVSAAGSQTFKDVRAWIDPQFDAVGAVLQATPADSGATSPIDISIRRTRGESPATQWTLDTHDTPLHCSALAEYVPEIQSLGGDAMFFGVMRWQLSSKDWWIDLSGSRFEDVSLSRLFERHAHRLTGSATVELKRCRIEPNHPRSDIAGTLWARNGVIGQTLLRSAKKHLKFALAPEVLATPTVDPEYDLLALDFELNSTQLAINGICRSDEMYHGFPADVVLCRDHLPLVQSTGTTINAIEIANVLASPASVSIPVSSQTTWLLNVLVPPSRPLPSESHYPPRIRSAGVSQGGPTIQQPTVR
ncbi:MAG: hypothetical protein AB8B91_05070 [Rubripirellula sp.]